MYPMLISRNGVIKISLSFEINEISYYVKSIGIIITEIAVIIIRRRGETTIYTGNWGVGLTIIRIVSYIGYRLL